MTITSSSVLISGKSYRLKYVYVQQSSIASPSFIFNIYLGTEKIIGEVKIIFGHLLCMNWSKSKYIIGDNYVDKLLPFLTLLLPSVNIPIKLLETTNDQGLICTVLFGYDNITQYDSDKKMFYIQATNTPEEMIEQYVFTYDKGDNNISFQILKFYNEHNRELKEALTPKEMQRYLFIDKDILSANMSYLDSRKCLFPKETREGEFAYILRSDGRAEYERILESKKQEKTNNYTIYAPKITTHGHNSPIFNQSTINIVDNHFEHLKQLIDKNNKTDNKTQEFTYIDQIKNKLKDPTKKVEVTKDIGILIQKYANYATIRQFIITYILPLINNYLATPVK